MTASMWLETAFGFCIFLMWALAVCHLFDGRRVHRLLAVAGAAVFAVGYACICFYAPDGSMPDQQFRQSLRGIYTPLCLLLFPLFFRRVPLRRRLGAGALFLCFTFFTDALLTIAALCAGFTPEAGRFSGFWQRLVFLALNLLLYGLAAGLTCRILRRRTLKLQAQTMALLCSLVLPFFCMVVVLLNGLSDTADSYARFSTVLLTLASVVLFLAAGGIAVHLHKISLEAERLRLVLEQQTLETGFYFELQRRTQEIRLLQHDIADQLQTVQLLLDNQDTAAAKDLLGEIDRKIAANKLPVYTENAPVNAILGMKLQQGEQQGLRFDVRINLPAHVPGVKLMDLNLVFLNLLNNAMEGCAALPNQEDKCICIKASCTSERLIVKVTNPVNPDLLRTNGKRLQTTKADPEQHGMGITILQRVVKKYDGEFLAERKGNLFEATAVLFPTP